MDAFADTTFTSFVPSEKSADALPVLLFQSGYGSTSASHAPLLQAIADGGYVVVVPDREGDVVYGKATPQKLFEGLAEGKPASELNAMSTDGTHLGAAFEYVQAQSSIDGQSIDRSKIAAGGFSMGCVEAMQFACAGRYADKLSACILISSSSGEMLEKLYCYKQADLNAGVSQFKFPSLYISSDLDSQLAATKEVYEAAASPAVMLVFKDSVLDNSMALTEETSVWSLAANDMLPGIAQHFALAAEKKVVSDLPIIAFMNEHIKKMPATALAPEGTLEELYTK